MSRRNRNKAMNNNSEINNIQHNNPTDTASSVQQDILFKNRDMVSSIVIGGFCIGLLLLLSEIIHRTNWLTSVIDQFNNLI